MPVLDRERLDEIVTAVCDRLEGEWLLIGGALVALWLAPRRTTEDVDIMGLGGTTAERLALMQLAQSLGLPVESVNSAADFFVQRIPDWRDHLVPFRSGLKASVLRPTATLFLLLKIGRLDEQDLEDCRAVLATGEAIDRDRVARSIDSLPTAPNTEHAARRAELQRLLAEGR